MSKREKDTGNDDNLIDWSEDKDVFTKDSVQKWLRKPVFEFKAFVYALCFTLLLMGIMFVITLSYHVINSTTKIGTFPMESWEDFKNLALIVGGFATFATVLRRLWIADKQRTTAEEKKEIDRQTHFTTLYIKAIELLGANHDGLANKETYHTIEIRIGAIYALERIAQDSRKDHPAIMEVLTAYIRKNSSLDKSSGPIKPDIQAAINVIGRRNNKWIKDEINFWQRLNLSNCNLHSVSFGRNTDFTNVNFQNSCLEKAMGKYANFYGARFQGAIFEATIIQECDLRKTDILATDININGLIKCIL